MGKTFVIIPKEEEAKNGLLQLVGELEFFFPDQVKVRDALALETGSLAMEAFFDMLAVQVDEKAIARAVEPDDVWAPLSEIEPWKPLSNPASPEEEIPIPTLVSDGSVCIECGVLLTGRKKKFCSNKCYMKDYNRRHPGKKHRNNGRSGTNPAVFAGVNSESGSPSQHETGSAIPSTDGEEEHQVLPWRILGSGREVNDIQHLLDSKKLKLGERVMEKGGRMFQVTTKMNGDHTLRPV